MPSCPGFRGLGGLVRGRGPAEAGGGAVGATATSQGGDMPIPHFDGILNALPPHLGTGGEIGDLSPYDCSLLELVSRFGTSDSRKQVLNGLLDFRATLFTGGMTGFVDPFFLSLGSPPAMVVDVTRYYFGLFSHRRDRVWKGLLAVELLDPADDAAARAALGSVS